MCAHVCVCVCWGGRWGVGGEGVRQGQMREQAWNRAKAVGGSECGGAGRERVEEA